MGKIKDFIREGTDGLRKEGSFIQNYAVVLSGTGVNIAIQIIISPVLTRIYNPEAYGVFSIFNAVCTNLALIATLRLPQALLLPREEKDFYTLMRLCVLSAIFTCVSILVVLFFASGPFLSIFQAEKLQPYYYLIPIMVFLIALNQVIGQWQYRLNLFKRSVALDTGVLVGVRIFNLVFGWLTKGMPLGLVAGDILGKTAGLILSWRLIIGERIIFFFTKVSLSRLKSILKQYKQYPLFNLPGVWLTVFSDQLSVFFISAAFGLKSVGTLALAVSMLDLPKRLLAYSVTSVFYRKAVDLHQQSFEKLQHMVVRMMYLFLLVSLIPYGIVAIFGPELFALVFGADWAMSGRIAQYFSVYCVLELLYFSVDSVYYVLRREKGMFAFQTSTFLLRFAVLFLGVHFSLSLEKCIIFLAMANTLLYSVQLSNILYLLKLNWWKHISIILLIIASVILLLFGVRTVLSGFEIL